jgi:hypothetical protein
MADWSVGDWAFVYYSEDGYWYPAEILKLEGKRYKVRYEYDDSEETVDADSVADYTTYAGENGAEAYSDEDESYYSVTILDTRDEEVQVQYEDETTEWVDLSYLRFEN